MVLKIRLARLGKRHAPFYNIVLCHARTALTSKPLEVLGTYNPLPQTPIDSASSDPNIPVRQYKDIQLDLSRTKYWLGVGAQPSDPAWKLLSMVGLLEPKFSKLQKKEQAERADESLKRLRRLAAQDGNQ